MPAEADMDRSPAGTTAGVRHAMIRHRSMHRALGTVLIGLAFATVAPATTALASREVPNRVCDIEWRQGTWHVKRLIRCVARRWDAPGTPHKAIAVARCESHLRPQAYNAGGYAGLFQQATRYWPTRAHHYGQPHRSVYNGRANVIVSIRMAATANSWSAWAGCA
jgi:hypothetical protein